MCLADLLVMIPNGSYLGGARKGQTQAAMLRKQGFRSGVADYFLPVPVPKLDSAGLWIELKRAVRSASHTSSDQEVFLADMRVLGYTAVLAYGAELAERKICDYLEQTGHAVTIGYGKQMDAEAIAFAQRWYDRRATIGAAIG